MYSPCEYVAPSLDKTKDNKYKKFVREITENYNSRSFAEKLEKFFAASTERNPPRVASLPDLLKTNFIVGETHHDRAPKNFLIENMRILKAAGYTTLFLEHLYYDDQQELDEYDPDWFCNSEKYQRTEARIERLNDDFSYPLEVRAAHDESCHCRQCTYLEKNHFLQLVKAAKRCGIRVVGIDTEYTYSEQYNERHKEYAYGGPTTVNKDSFRERSMNYTAAKIIEKETQEHTGKWFALMGEYHCYSSEEFSGVPQLTGATTALVSTDKKLDKIKVQFDGVASSEESIEFGSNLTRIVKVPYGVNIQTPLFKSIPAIKSPVVQTMDSRKEEEKEQLRREFPRRCAAQIKRLDSLSKIFNNPHAREKKRILESAQKILNNENLSVSDRFTAFHTFINDNRAILTRPHSTIPKDVMKGLLVFVVSTLLVVPGILLGMRFFSSHRSTTIEEEIVKPLNDLTL
ncbi:membrane-targeted effector domain-containing toxin [Legionella sp. PC997]|uniref:membrane-targeted effector domain-containing toxin n=1 Tax=Legionella sp. PC997 TaxID=2755562 RepID=UPI0015FDB918|nr:membrane-targeted effector domain-containing toxin [Legionella sp. PC997]QMT59151.1 hypothetical protein HBNCFIEN_00512 [Legionella sp. PC997]